MADNDTPISVVPHDEAPAEQNGTAPVATATAETETPSADSGNRWEELRQTGTPEGFQQRMEAELAQTTLAESNGAVKLPPIDYAAFKEFIYAMNGHSFNPNEVQNELGMNEYPREFGELLNKAINDGLIIGPKQDTNGKWYTEETNESLMPRIMESLGADKIPVPQPWDDSVEEARYQKALKIVEGWRNDQSLEHISPANLVGTSGITAPLAEKIFARLVDEGEIGEKDPATGFYGIVPTSVPHNPVNDAEASEKPAPEAAPATDTTAQQPDTAAQQPTTQAQQPPQPGTPAEQTEQDQQQTEDAPANNGAGPQPGQQNQQQARDAAANNGATNNNGAGPPPPPNTQAEGPHDQPPDDEQVRPSLRDRFGERLKQATSGFRGDPDDTTGKLHGDYIPWILKQHGNIADTPHNRLRHIGRHSSNTLVLHMPNRPNTKVVYTAGVLGTGFLKDGVLGTGGILGGHKGKIVGRGGDAEYHGLIATLGLQKGCVKIKGSWQHQLFAKAHGIVAGIDVITSEKFTSPKMRRLLAQKVDQLQRAGYGPVERPDEMPQAANGAARVPGLRSERPYGTSGQTQGTFRTAPTPPPAPVGVGR